MGNMRWLFGRTQRRALGYSNDDGSLQKQPQPQQPQPQKPPAMVPTTTTTATPTTRSNDDDDDDVLTIRYPECVHCGVRHDPLNFCRHEEHQYLDLLRRLLVRSRDGQPFVIDRTKVGTISEYAHQVRFNLEGNTMPLLTTKRVSFTNVATELQFFIHGKTDSKWLEAQNVNIWKVNGSRAFLDEYGFTEREEGDLGPIYGYQWRHAGAEYTNCKADYTGQGIDQLQNAIDILRTDPASRRVCISAWVPQNLEEMVLPPCHCFFQFCITWENKLICMMTQRSADLGLGVPYNIASYALLTHIVAQLTGSIASELVITFNDMHVYRDHVGKLIEQLRRDPKPFPKLVLSNLGGSVDNFTWDCARLENYECHPFIPMKMAA
jgi:thymidylate synthase